MGQALYRTYRSKDLSEIVGQEHITIALKHALEKGTISHAYLFTGPRGTGKTSIARILAHRINGLEYGDTQPHLDIIEIDAASNRRIDEIRDLRDKVHIAPSSARYKVYIIDEVHMLTKEAFNALLKTLEEPPAHVVFILATTEVHKLPETIISRTQRYAFKPVDHDKVVVHLKHIAKEEGIAIDDDALELIAAHGEGSFRDSISLLDQVRNNKDRVTLAAVQAVLGIAPAEIIDNTVHAIQQHDSVAVAQHAKQMNSQGYEASQIAKQLGSQIREALIAGDSLLPHEIAIRLLTQLVLVSASPNPAVALEIALLDAALSGSEVRTPTPQSSIQKPPKAAEPKVMHEEVQAPAAPAIQIDSKKHIREAVAETTETPDRHTTTDPDMILTEKAWDIILNALKQKHNTLYNVAQSAKTHFSPGKVTLEVTYAFHQKRLNDVHNKQLLFDIIAGVTGSELQIEAILGEGKPRSVNTALPPADGEVVHAVQSHGSDTPAAKHTDPSLDAISDIFGGAEVLES